jgi:2-polyprenyl-6-methoxyphenol hydroxylase-like FAD-dependent oxidoreductase
MLNTMTKQTQAVVIGASIAGLLAARALSETFDRVTIVERDALPDAVADRRGVPQGKHLHGLQGGGLAALEALFPGFADDLLSAGAISCDVQSDVHWWVGGWLVKPEPSGIHGIACSRRLLEHTVRQRVRAQPGVEINDRCDVLGLNATDSNDKVTGIHIMPRVNGASADDLGADLVIDAAGRSSRSAEWLAALGYTPPTSTRIPVDITYVTRSFHRKSDQIGGRTGISVNHYPGSLRGGFVLAQENDTFILSLSGIYGQEPPMDDAGVTEYCATMPTDELADFIRTATPISEPTKAHYRASVRRHYESMTQFPDGYLVMGDAVCSFNPVYGQGMSVAASEAVLLRDLLVTDRPALAKDFFAGASNIIDIPWIIAASQDLSFAEAAGSQTEEGAAFGGYLQRLLRAASVDASVGKAFLRVINLIDTPQQLLEPQMVARVEELVPAAANSSMEAPIGRAG